MDIINGKAFFAMVDNGLRSLKAHYQEINDLNVFPVPDGDTGTNMTATLQGGVEAMEKLPQDHVGKEANALAGGMLLAARGNSGVILSQYFAGIAKSLSEKEEAGIEDFVLALEEGTKTAYKAVDTPVEGTILTVARKGSEYLASHLSEIDSFEKLFGALHDEMSKALDDTPNLLAVLKEAGVIDSGGAGLLRVIDGMGKEVIGEEVADSPFVSPSSSAAKVDLSAFNEDSELTYGYCTEFILQLQNSKNGPKAFSLDEMLKYFRTIGDSIVALRQNNIVKVHVHTKTPALAIEYAQKYGEFLTFKMENMNLQHNEILLKEMPIEEEKKEKYAMVAVAPSPEIAELFHELKVKQTVSGGQSMNPSADDFIEAFKAANAENIIVFPNNGNVILTAQQAASLYQDANVIVVPSKSVVQAYSAIQMVDFDENSLQENLDIIQESIDGVVSGEVSAAIRDSLNNGISIKKGDAIGILQGKVVADDSSVVDCLFGVLSHIEDIDDRSVITVFWGKDVDEETKDEVRERCEKVYPLMDLEEVQGNQAVYPFIVAVE